MPWRCWHIAEASPGRGGECAHGVQCRRLRPPWGAGAAAREVVTSERERNLLRGLCLCTVDRKRIHLPRVLSQDQPVWAWRGGQARDSGDMFTPHLASRGSSPSCSFRIKLVGVSSHLELGAPASVAVAALWAG